VNSDQTFGIQAIPPVPPTPPFDPDSFFPWLMVLAALTAATIILWPIMRALGRRMEHKGEPDPALRAEIEQLHHHLAEIEPMHARIAELEERLDFAERLLAQTKESERLQR
jgi:flagellar biosynthesis/type III secretory pathway M-ring protein FliF/YscJ